MADLPRVLGQRLGLVGPQVAAADAAEHDRTTASVGCWTFGSATSATRTSPAWWISVARMNSTLPDALGPGTRARQPQAPATQTHRSLPHRDHQRDPDKVPHGRVPAVAGRRVRAWTDAARSATSSPPAAPGSPPSRPASPSPLAGARRVPGLRREEVALLAGVSVPYYTRLERGNARGASDAVLDALARALQLDDAEHAHLFDLVRTANATAAAARTPRHPARRTLRPELWNMLDAMNGVPAYVRNGRLDLLAANALGRALFAPVFDSPARPANSARFIFLDPAARDFYPDWDAVADQNVATLRAEAGRNPHDKALSDLIGELSTRSDTFRPRWARHDVRRHRTGANASPTPWSAT